MIQRLFDETSHEKIFHIYAQENNYCDKLRVREMCVCQIKQIRD